MYDFFVVGWCHGNDDCRVYDHTDTLSETHIHDYIGGTKSELVRRFDHIEV